MTWNLMHYIAAKWHAGTTNGQLSVIDPATEEVVTVLGLGGLYDVDLAVAAARSGCDHLSSYSVAERAALLQSILDQYVRRIPDLGEAISLEMGAPLEFARNVQAGTGAAHLQATIDCLNEFSFEERRPGYLLLREPIGVAGMITPWNWPMNQICAKVAAAIAAGCAVILKPSELAPLSASIFAEIIHAAGVPSGIFNMVHGDGASVGRALAAHRDVDMISFTGSTRAGVEVAKTAADTVKRVAQELGGKSANILLEDCDLVAAVTRNVRSCVMNSGQSCNAPTRMLVPASLHDMALEIAASIAQAVRIGAPADPLIEMGPLANAAQFDKVRSYIEIGECEGATLAAGGTRRPNGLSRGFYVAPTIFGDVTPDMVIAREEIFGPVLSIIPYRDEAEAVEIANGSIYGLAGYIESTDPQRAARIARSIRAGTIYINGPDWNPNVPFGGYRQSGNGREYAEHGLSDFLEIKGVVTAGA